MRLVVFCWREVERGEGRSGREVVVVSRRSGVRWSRANPITVEEPLPHLFPPANKRVEDINELKSKVERAR